MQVNNILKIQRFSYLILHYLFFCVIIIKKENDFAGEPSMLDQKLKNDFLEILTEELVPAMG